MNQTQTCRHVLMEVTRRSLPIPVSLEHRRLLSIGRTTHKAPVLAKMQYWSNCRHRLLSVGAIEVGSAQVVPLSGVQTAVSMEAASNYAVRVRPVVSWAPSWECNLTCATRRPIPSSTDINSRPKSFFIFVMSGFLRLMSPSLSGGK